MRGIIANRLLEEKGEEPTDDEIEAVIYEKLLTAENRLRGIMGLALHAPDHIQVIGGCQLPAELLAHGGGGVLKQHIDNFMVFQCF